MRNAPPFAVRREARRTSGWRPMEMLLPPFPSSAGQPRVRSAAGPFPLSILLQCHQSLSFCGTCLVKTQEIHRFNVIWCNGARTTQCNRDEDPLEFGRLTLSLLSLILFGSDLASFCGTQDDQLGLPCCVCGVLQTVWQRCYVSVNQADFSLLRTSRPAHRHMLAFRSVAVFPSGDEMQKLIRGTFPDPCLCHCNQSRRDLHSLKRSFHHYMMTPLSKTF
jgi:hypothetical protein